MKKSSPPLERQPRYLRMVLGPKAAADEELRSAIEDLRKAGSEIEVRLTWEEEDARYWAKEGALGGCDAVVAAGGDGTVGDVAAGILDAQSEMASADAPIRTTALGILPYGTANDLAKSAGLDPTDPVAALSLLTDENRRTIDVAQANDHPFLNMATAGFGAEVTTETRSAAKKWLGGLSYVLTGLSKAARLEACHLHLKGPDFAFEGNTLVVAVGNGRRAGGGLQLCPKAYIDDGLLDVMILPEIPMDELLPWLGDAFLSGKFLDLGPLIYRRLPWLEIRSEEPFQLNIDGEPLYGSEAHLEIIPSALDIHLPASELFSA